MIENMSTEEWNSAESVKKTIERKTRPYNIYGVYTWHQSIRMGEKLKGFGRTDGRTDGRTNGQLLPYSRSERLKSG